MLLKRRGPSREKKMKTTRCQYLISCLAKLGQTSGFEHFLARSCWCRARCYNILRNNDLLSAGKSAIFLFMPRGTCWNTVQSQFFNVENISLRHLIGSRIILLRRKVIFISYSVNIGHQVLAAHLELVVTARTSSSVFIFHVSSRL